MLGVNYLRLFGVTFVVVFAISVSVIYKVNPLSFSKDNKNLELTFKELAEISPAAGGSVDDLLSWGDDNPVAAPTRIPPPSRIRKSVPINVNNQAPSMKKQEAEPVVVDKEEMNKAIAIEQSSNVNSHIDKKIKELEKRFIKLEKSIKSLKASSVKKSDIASLKKVVLSMQKELIKFINNNKGDVVSNKNVARKKKAPLKSNSNWVLRSAKYDVAWVSKKGSNDLIAVSVGDTLPEIGSVKEIIKNKSGIWIVKGDKGEIRQR